MKYFALDAIMKKSDVKFEHQECEGVQVSNLESLQIYVTNKHRIVEQYQFLQTFHKR